MPKLIAVLAGQCLVDVALQHLGDEGEAFALAELNGLPSVSVDLQPGLQLLVPDLTPEQARRVALLRAEQSSPQSPGLRVPDDFTPMPGGIGWMRIVNPAAPAAPDDFRVR